MKIKCIGFNNGEIEEKAELDFDVEEYVTLALEEMTPEEFKLYKQHKKERNERVYKKFEEGEER